MRERLSAHFSERNIVKQLRIGHLSQPMPATTAGAKTAGCIISSEDALHLAADTIEELKLSISPARLLTEVSHYKSNPQQDLDADFQEAFLLYNQKITRL